MVVDPILIADIASNTAPVGNNIPVLLTDVELTFDNVAVSGLTSRTATTAALVGGKKLAGMQFGSDGLVYDIIPGASFTGGVTVCLNYDPLQFPDENGLQLLHLNHVNNAWENITSSHAPATDQICGRTTSFSHFAVAHPSSTYVSLTVFEATVNNANEVLLHWATDLEFNHYGFELIREDVATGAANVINTQVGGNASGADYQFVDTDAVADNHYAYTLIDIDTKGKRTVHGPLDITVISGQTFTFDPESNITAVTVDHAASISNQSNGGGALSVGWLLFLSVALIGNRRRYGSAKDEPNSLSQPLNLAFVKVKIFTLFFLNVRRRLFSRRSSSIKNHTGEYDEHH